MNINWQIIQTLKELSIFIATIDNKRPIAADVETYKQRPSQRGARLLGLAISGYNKTGEVVSAYVVLNYYQSPWFKVNMEIGSGGLTLMFFFLENKLVGWNVPFDKSWLDRYTGIDTQWQADGRIMWHLQNNDPAIRGFGLKLAQKKLLGWSESNDKELEENVAKYGGKLASGDHYLADLHILAKYACLDTYATLVCYEKLLPFMQEYDYMSFHDEILNYAIHLHSASSQGLPVDESELLHASALYKQKREIASQSLVTVCQEEINAIEHTWHVKKAATYKTDRGRSQFVSSPGRQRRFNPSSAKQRELLLHTMLEFPVNERTPKGQAKTDRANIAVIPHPSAKELIDYSEYKKVAEQAQTYLNYIEEGRLHTNYDVCGTVSGRLSGFKPSVLNMPFSEPEVMHAFKSDSEFIGIHADLAAIEPCVLAHYSEDSTLLKVYRQGLGDIYLDLALDIFPDDIQLRTEYDPNVPIKSEVKERFKDLRAVCKIVHLAVSYTGTYITVAKNLSKNGYPTSKGQAMQLVKRYWQKFSQVKAFNNRLQQVYTHKGHIRNLVGRVIQVPEMYKKDLMNRLVQSSAHDILRLWVMTIVELFNKRNIEWKWWLPDLHDSTTFMVKQGQEERAKECYLDALDLVWNQLQLSVPLKCELKYLRTLAGVKSNEL